MRRLWKLAAVGSIALAGGVMGAGATVAGAAPSHAPSSYSGTFTCTGSTGTFVVNTGDSTATTWSAAHLTFSTGGRGIFVPSQFHLVFDVVTAGGTVVPVGTQTAVKGSGHAPSPDTCHITAVVAVTPTTTLELVLTGTVVGKIVMNG